jgi:hypothetical protein
LLEINPHHENDALFINAVEEILSDPAADAFYKELNIQTLDVSPLLEPADYYVLDDHMRARGHKVVAETLRDSLKVILAKD